MMGVFLRLNNQQTDPKLAITPRSQGRARQNRNLGSPIRENQTKLPPLRP